MDERFTPALDRPENIDYYEVSSDQAWRLANQDIHCQIDADCTLNNLIWPWANATYVRKIEFHISDPRDDALNPIWVRHYPAYHETIYGNEGMIISKQLLMPLKSHYDRSILWLLACQAEGDRLLRVEVDIQWDQPLTQCMVDGLLVAQDNPRPAQGVYGQCNADSTRVFGNPEASPDAIEFNDHGGIRLIYHVLINGLVTIPFILTISDVGEQVAWNGFLALREGRHVFETSNRRWDEILKTGRLWTPEPAFNWAVQQGRIETLRHCQRIRTGLAPSDRLTTHVPLLVESFDTFDPVQSRNLLAHLRRVAEKAQGHLPVTLPLRAKETAEKPGAALAQTVTAYLLSLHNHLQRYFDTELLAEHQTAIQLCTEALIQSYNHDSHLIDPDYLAYTLQGLGYALQLAKLLEETDIEHWQQLYDQCHSDSVDEGSVDSDSVDSRSSVLEYNQDWQQQFQQWQRGHISLQSENIWQRIALAGGAVWQGCGLQPNLPPWNSRPESETSSPESKIEPQWPAAWQWWALTSLYRWDGSKLSMASARNSGQTWSIVAHDEIFYTTQPITSTTEWLLCSEARTQNIDELEFDLQFELILAETGEAHIYKPTFNVIYFLKPISNR